MELINSNQSATNQKIAPCNDLLESNQNEISTSLSDKKEIDINSDERFITICINKKYKTEDINETYINTLIVKDKLLKTTETHIKKVFVHHKKNGSKNVILREINIDRFKNESVRENKSIHMKLDKNESIENKITILLQSFDNQLLLN